MNTTEYMSQKARIERMANQELIRRRDMALGAVAEISDNLADGANMPASSQEELRESRELFHGDLSAYWVELARRDVHEQ